MFASVTFALADGSEATLGPGDLLGRVWSSTLRLDDPGVSEAHALVSLRGEELHLLALRGRFLADGQAVTDLALAPGQVLRLSAETELRVVSVTLPAEILAVEGPGLPRTALRGTTSLVRGRLVPGAHAEADAVLWSVGDGWRLRPAGLPAQEATPGATFVAGGATWRLTTLTLARAGQDGTLANVDTPLRIVAHFDTVHLQRDGRVVLALAGLPARLVSELVAVRAPLSWDALAAGLWPDDEDRTLLRKRWDVLLARLRQRLRVAGVRPDLVSSSRAGHVELLLGPADEIEDHT